ADRSGEGRPAVTRPLIFHPEVASDLRVGFGYYEARQIGLGDRFLAAVRDVYDRVAAMPELYGAVWETVRFVQLRKFPFGVYYQVDPDRVYVIAVYNTYRDPAGWQRRVSSN